jgi:hypothetical protein
MQPVQPGNGFGLVVRDDAAADGTSLQRRPPALVGRLRRFGFSIIVRRPITGRGLVLREGSVVLARDIGGGKNPRIDLIGELLGTAKRMRS